MRLARAAALRRRRRCSSASVGVVRARAAAAVRAGRPIAYLRILGASGLFIAILACGVAAAWIALLRRRLRAPLADWGGALLGVATFALLSALHVSLPGAIAAAMHPIARLGDTYLALDRDRLDRDAAVDRGRPRSGDARGDRHAGLSHDADAEHARVYGARAAAVHRRRLALSLRLSGRRRRDAAARRTARDLARSAPAPRRARDVHPALFNLNEPLLFAAPVVFNPHLVVPFVGAPLVLATVTYAAVATGLVSRAAFYIPSSVPTFVSTYLATQDVRAIALAALNIALATLIYYPFVRAYERHVSSDGDVRDRRALRAVRHRRARFARRRSTRTSGRATLDTYPAQQRVQPNVLQAFLDEGIAESDLAGSTGYGYDDPARARYESLLARVLGAERAIARLSIVSGTHAIVAALAACTPPGAHAALDLRRAVRHAAQRDLRRAARAGSRRHRVPRDRARATTAASICTRSARALAAGDVATVFVQRSRGYAPRRSLSVAECERAYAAVKTRRSRA